MKNLIKVFLWYPTTILMITGLYFAFNSNLGKQSAPHLVRQSIDTVTKNKSILFAAIPLASLDIKSAIASEDARPIIIERYLRHYSSPMLTYSGKIVGTADKYGVDPYLVVAIAQQESNLGKITPPSCHNAWGWGIHSAGTLCFDNWDEGIETFTRGLSDKYIAYGLQTPEEIMTKYNATSPGGAWSKGVSQFLDELRSGTW
ncbi:MAG: hypothetical protein WCL07_02500 [bacterium]